jgi:hypothetical protein
MEATKWLRLSTSYSVCCHLNPRSTIGNESNQGTASCAGRQAQSVSARDIGLWVDAYIEANRQALIEQAIEIVNHSPTFRKFYEREQRERAKLRKNAQTQKPCSNTTISVQMSGAQ